MKLLFFLFLSPCCLAVSDPRLAMIEMGIKVLNDHFDVQRQMSAYCYVLHLDLSPIEVKYLVSIRQSLTVKYP